MLQYRQLELLIQGPVSKVRILNPGPFSPEEVAELANEWNSIANQADCQELVVDCSKVQVLSSEMLSKLILLQRQLKEKKAKLVLSGVRAEVHEVLSWTKLDRLFEIQEDQEATAFA